MPRTLLLVTGAGRSGTSTMAGALHHLGVHTPGPFLDANPSNPKGFFESRWSVRFHNRLLRRANAGIADGRPDAVEHVRRAVRPTDYEALRNFLIEASGDAAVTVVKDPRATWTLDVWRSVGQELGLRTAVAVMLRHPAQVIGSRSTHYAAGADVLGDTGYAIHNGAGWLNATLTGERESRHLPRVFVRYDELLEDWRASLRGLFDHLELPMPDGLDLEARTPHPVDEFVDPGLSRHPLTWSDVPLPAALRELAEETWQTGTAAAAEPTASDAARWDDLGERYARLYAEARALVHDATVAEVKAVQRKAEQRARKEQRRGSLATRLRRRIAP